MEETLNESTPTPTERELLKQKADLLGLTYASNISTDKLRDLINQANAPVEVKQDTLVNKSGSSVEDEAMALRLELTKKIRVMITCNDPLMKDWDMTPYYSFSNSTLTLDSITIPLGVEWHIPNAYVGMLQAMECKIPVKTKDEKGRPITTRRTIKKYNVNILPPLTAEELEALKMAQVMRDGL